MGTNLGGVYVEVNDSIIVSSVWELTPVPVRYSQGDRVSTSLSRTSYCTHVLLVCLRYCSILCYPWHDHVLLGTITIKSMCVHHLYPQG